jgi:hypothetical protein
MSEIWALVARGQMVHPTVAAQVAKLGRDDIMLIPILDLPAIPIGLTWMKSHENARIRAFAEVALMSAPASRTTTSPKPIPDSPPGRCDCATKTSAGPDLAV